MARRMGVSQQRVAVIEDYEGSLTIVTLIRHVQALGGRLRIRVSFPDQEYEL